ncbi:MAG: phospholipid/cholesterol/gamma-HCH transport system substrate-binding protein, partial [Myxococcota bacterium]
MDNARASLLVGVVVLLGIAAFVGMYSVTGAGLGNQKTYEVYGLFDDVSGLSPQTRVTVAGVKVGEVVSIGIDPNSPDLARVVIALKDDVEILGGEL